MNKTVVLYKSKYGAAKKYAEWIKVESGCDLFETDRSSGLDLEGYDKIILAGGVYAGGVAGLKKFKQKFSGLQGKKIAIFAVGASPLDEKALEQLRQTALQEVPADIPLFYGRGIFDLKKMGFLDRTMCRMLKKSVAKKEAADMEPWMEALLSSGDEGFDGTDKAYLEPLFRYMKDSEIS